MGYYFTHFTFAAESTDSEVSTDSDESVEHRREHEDGTLHRLPGQPEQAARASVRKRRRRLVYHPTPGGDGLCTQADLDEHGPDSPGVRALRRQRRRLVYRPIHRLAELIMSELEKGPDKDHW